MRYRSGLMDDSDLSRAQYLDQGYLGPVRILSPAQCRAFLRWATDASLSAPLDWSKGHAATSRAFYEIATHPAIVERVKALLGDDVILWGASIETRDPGVAHPWHTDIESAATKGTAVSVWIGLEHTTRDSSLTVVPYSHHFGACVQEVRHQQGKSRAGATNTDILGWAQERDTRAAVHTAEMTDGDALFFDGRLWHSSRNASRKTRRALLLQYATPDTPIRIPDFNYLDWPFRKFTTPRPPCVMISGRAKGDNRIVPGPVADGPPTNPRLTNRVYPLRVPLEVDAVVGWKPYYVFAGCTSNVDTLTCHASSLVPGHSPHPPHVHDEDEILILLAGEADLLLPELPGAAAGQGRLPLKAGQLVYYPAHFPHSLRTTGDAPANYLMFKWRNTGAPSKSAAMLTFNHARPFEPTNEAAARGFSVQRLFEGPTQWLGNLECHASTLAPGAGYDPHIDAHDVAILVLDGEVETLGERVGPHAVIFHPGGELHGIRNPGDVAARYVVFEFHGRRSGRLRKPPPHTPSLFTKLRDPQRWKYKLRQVLGRLRR